MNIYQLIYLIWFFSEIYLNRFVRSGKSDKKSSDRNTENYLWVSIVFSITIGVFVSANFAHPIFSGELLSLIGVIIIIIGMIIRFVAIKQLGRFFTVNVTIRTEHQLVQRGFYKYLRHPSYSGSLLSFLGFGLSLNNWLSLMIIFLPTLFAFIYRMKIEENVLAEQFGEQYQDYLLKTKRIIPFIY
jgi:protein-S-isoprenylcysteine O-methyltransferase Ste14